MVIDVIKKILGKDMVVSSAELDHLKGLSPEKVQDELGSLLSKICIDLSADFVKSELVRAESPFGSLDKSDFFHEMLIMNFWIVDKVFSKHMKHLSGIVLARCQVLFPHSGEKFALVPDRFRRYYDSWDDHTGHQDLFAQEAGKILFGDTPYMEKQAAFWLIIYADKTVKALKKVRKACRERELFVKEEVKK